MNRLAVLLLTLLATGCSSAPQYQVRKLPSGREVKLWSMTRGNVGMSGPTLMLNYQTDLDMNNKKELTKEAQEIWQVFKIDADNAKVQAAVISAHDEPRGFIIKNGSAYNFVFEKASDGTWRMLE